MSFKANPYRRIEEGSFLCGCVHAHTHRYANTTYFILVLEFGSEGDPSGLHSPHYLLPWVTVPQSFTLP